MSHEILLRQLKLGSEDKPFVLVGVIRTEGPTAIKAGNKAIILSDGSIEGWVGGHCTEGEIVTNAFACLKDGTARSLNLTTCQGGRMDVYLEPYLPKRKLIILGHVPIVGALSHLAKMLNFDVTVVDKQASKDKFPDADVILKSLGEFRAKEITRQTYAVVATMGEFDQDYVEKLADLDVPYVGVVAGKKRASYILSFLRAKNVPEDRLSKIKAPAGIYIRAITAEEIALSIMAEIVESARTKNNDPREYAQNIAVHDTPKTHEISQQDESKMRHTAKVLVDPVCGMTIDASSNYFTKVNDRIVYFCCESCKDSFDSDPRKYLLEQNL